MERAPRLAVLVVQGLYQVYQCSLEMSTTHTSLAVERKANAQSVPKYKGTQESCPGIGCWRWVSSFLISQAVGETKGTMTKVMGFVQEGRKANK